MKSKLIAFLINFLAFLPLANAGETEVVTMLSARDSQRAVSLEELEQLAGGQEELIKILIKYRRSETPPFVGIRAERLLLNYTSNQEVMSALESDVNDSKYFGLARTIGTHLDTIKNSQAKTRLATAVLRKAETESRYRMFGKMLLESSDENIQRLAREANLE